VQDFQLSTELSRLLYHLPTPELSIQFSANCLVAISSQSSATVHSRDSFNPSLSCLRSSLHNLEAAATESTVFWQFLCCYRGIFTPPLHRNGSSVACVFISVGTCLPNNCLAMNVCSGSAIPACRRYVTLLLSRVGVSYKTGFGLVDWIYCTLYIHNSRLQAIQHYRYSTHFQFTVTHALESSIFTSRILATDL
jgi:hypothetical protein